MTYSGFGRGQADEPAPADGFQGVIPRPTPPCPVSAVWSRVLESSDRGDLQLLRQNILQAIAA